MTDQELENIIRRSAEHGASEALKKIGLDDDLAWNDVHELRDLLAAWRLAKRTVFTTVVKWVTVAFLALLAFAAVYFR